MGRARAMEVFDNGSVTVILGDGFSARMIALRVLLLEDRRCVICDRRRTVWSYILPFAASLCFGEACDVRLAVDQLCDLADLYPDGQKFIVLGNSSFASLCADEIDRLECRYIFSDGSGIAPRSEIRRA